jgi:signal transduction histidine kinase
MSSLSEDQLRRLLDAGRALVAELDPEAVLQRILDDARGITGARYVALGVLNEQRTELGRFLTSGVDAETLAAIGDLPRGRGVLGVLIADPRPLRLADVARHPQSFGFPAHHPAMRSFLGVPIVIRGQAWGNLYLADKDRGGEFTEADEEAAVVLALWAATAIENARLHDASERRRHEAERAVQGLRAARDIADAIAEVNELDSVLELIVERGRALVAAQTVLIMLREGEELVVAASAGDVDAASGHRLPIGGSTSGAVLERGRAHRVADAAELRVTPDRLGVPDAHTALLVPMIHRGVRVGVLVAFDRGERGEPFTQDDEQLLRAFASSAVNAVTIQRSVEADRLRATITAAEAERGRWARELHDETLQGLAGLRVSLARALRRDSERTRQEAIRQAIEAIELETDNLRAIIADLRPSLLDDLGLVPAIEALLDRRRSGGLEIESELSFPEAMPALGPQLETTIYRLVQEALTNVVKHAGGSSAHVAIRLDDECVRVEVSDDGAGFDPHTDASGFGLEGMRERVYLAGGQLELSSGSAGTVVRARLPRDPIR